MNVLSLFAGIGGLDLGLEWAGCTVVGQVEIEPYCQRVLAKHWPGVPRHGDVHMAAAWWLSEERPVVDVICGGFPCQDISHAGKRAGITGARSGLWDAMADCVREIRPRFVLVENVAAILVRGLDTVAGTLAEIGYDLRWDCVPAAAIGAPHRRDRWFGIATDAHGGRLPQQPQCHSQPGAGITSTQRHNTVGFRDDVADADGAGQSDIRGRGPLAEFARWPESRRNSWWDAEPDVGRVAHGIPARMDRLRALGNAVVPQVAQHIGEILLAMDDGAP